MLKLLPKLYHLTPDFKVIEGQHKNLTGTDNLYGDCTHLKGDCSGLFGYVCHLYGDATGLVGYTTGIKGDLDSITEQERKIYPKITYYVR